MSATLVSLYGDDTAEDSFGLAGDEIEALHGLSTPALRVVHRWRKLTPRQQRIAAGRYPELMGILPIIAKIAAGAAKVGGKLVGAIAKRVREKRAKRANDAAAKMQAAAPAPAPVQAAAPAPVAPASGLDVSKLAPYLIPAVALVAVMLLKKK